MPEEKDALPLRSSREVRSGDHTPALPVLFTAHGNPMNALGRTAFARFLAGWGASLPRPRAVLVVSAHWESPRLAVTSAARPGVLHDFRGFPPALYALDYPAPGDPLLATGVVAALREAGLDAVADPERPLDHGAWAPLRLLFPEARTPVVQLSLLRGVAMSRHLEVGRALAGLRAEGVLIVASGNLVHALAEADLRREDAPVPGWAREFDAWLRDRLDEGALDDLARWESEAPHAVRAHPTPEHLTPLLVAAAAAGSGAGVSHPYEGFEHGSLSLRCVRFD